MTHIKEEDFKTKTVTLDLKDKIVKIKPDGTKIVIPKQ